MTIIRITEGGPRVIGTFTFDPQDDQWGIAEIAGQTYAACLTYDGDGVIQLADNEVDRYLARTETGREVPYVR